MWELGRADGAGIIIDPAKGFDKRREEKREKSGLRTFPNDSEKKPA